MYTVFGLLLGGILLFASGKFRFDMVALAIVTVLILTGILTPVEALSGFGNPIVITIAGLFVVGGALIQTGVADQIGRLMIRLAGRGEGTLIAVTMIISAGLSGFMSSTGTTAILLPVLISISRSTGINPSKLLIPLAFSSLLGGILTLIGTPPNIVVSNQLAANGYQPFGFFTFMPVGLILLLVGLIFMLTIGRRLLPDSDRSMRPGSEIISKRPSVAELAKSYRLSGNSFRMRVRATSPLIGKTLAESDLHHRYGVTVFEIQQRISEDGPLLPARPADRDSRLEAHCILFVHGNDDMVRKLATEEDLALLVDSGKPVGFGLRSRELGLAEILIPPSSRMVGKTLSELSFRDRYGVTVTGIKRLGEPITEDLRDIKLQFSDALLVEGRWERINLMRGETQNFIVVGLPLEMEAAQRPLDKAGLSIGVLVLMILMLTLELVPIVSAVLLAALSMIVLGCVTAEEAYRRMNWESVVLIAGMLPMATALEKTGGMSLVAESMIQLFGQFGPYALMAGVFLLTSFFSHFVSNTATAVLVAPIAFQAAIGLDVAPEPFMMLVAVAASTSFATPVASPSNTLVYGPGGYRFGDYVRVGLGLQGIILVVCLIILPLLFPF